MGQASNGDRDLIVYTSADPVLQIAAHEDIIPLEELYDICEKVRELTKDPKYLIGRIIARPYVGEPGNFTRTSNRHDYALKPFGKTVMNSLKDNHYDVIAIGKINDIYDGEGVMRRFVLKIIWMAWINLSKWLKRLYWYQFLEFSRFRCAIWSSS